MSNLTPQDWIDAASARLAREGVEAVRIEPLAADLHVSKGSFYWHFADRGALLAAILDNWRLHGTDSVIASTDNALTDPARRLRDLLHEAYAHPHHDGFEVAVRAWAASPSTAGHDAALAAVMAVDRTRMDYVTRLLVATGIGHPLATTRARQLYQALLGEYLMRHYGHPATPPHELDEAVNNALDRPQ